MASQPGPGASGTTVPLPEPSGRPAKRWAEIDVSEARKAFFLMVGFIALIWMLQIANWADRYGLDAQYGIIPRNLLRLPDIFIAPFLHASWDHIESNSGPLFIFGFLAAYRGVLRFLGVTLVVAIVSGLAVWFFQGSGLTVGASGLIFGYFGYLVARGLIDRNLVDVLISAVMGLSFYYVVAQALPGTAGNVSWLGHLGGLVGGIACGWVFRTRRGRAGRPAAAGAEPAQRAGPAPGTAGAGAAGAGTGFQPDPGNPRAMLHEELRKLGF